MATILADKHLAVTRSRKQAAEDVYLNDIRTVADQINGEALISAFIGCEMDDVRAVDRFSEFIEDVGKDKLVVPHKLKDPAISVIVPEQCTGQTSLQE